MTLGTSIAAPGDASSRDSRGFSLLEVLCAVLVLGVALVGLTEGITTALQSNKDSELQTTAALFAAGVIETLRAEGSLVNGTTEGTCGADLPQYDWKQSIVSGGLEGLYEVAVSVHHTRSGKIICELKTLLFEMPEDTGPSARTGQQPRARENNRNRRS